MGKTNITNEVLEYLKSQDEPPTYRQLTKHFNVGMAVMFRTVDELREQGEVKKSNGKAGIVLSGRLSYRELMAENKRLGEYNRKLLADIDELYKGLGVLDRALTRETGES